MRTENTIDVKNLCSSKLLELLRVELPEHLAREHKALVAKELQMRQHYLPELEAWRQQRH